jgi:hypothetical protein
MGQGPGVMGQSRTPNGDRLVVFTSQQDQWRGCSPRRTVTWLQRVESTDMCNETTSFRCPTGHSGCFKTLSQVSRRPERQDQGSKGLSWCRQEPPGRYDIPEPCCTSDSVTTNHSGHTHCHWHPPAYRSWIVHLHDLIPGPSLPTINTIDKHPKLINCYW